MAASIVNSVTPEVSASEETIGVVESASVENTAIPDMITSEKLSLTAPRDLSSKPNEDTNLHLSGECVHKGSSSSDAFEFASGKLRLKLIILQRISKGLKMQRISTQNLRIRFFFFFNFLSLLNTAEQIIC